MKRIPGLSLVSVICVCVLFAQVVLGAVVHEVTPWMDYVAQRKADTHEEISIRWGDALGGVLSRLASGQSEVMFNTGSATRLYADGPVTLVPARKYFRELPSRPFVAPGENIALHKTYTWHRAPNYPLCASKTDGLELTDGYQVRELKGKMFWVRPETVGWMSPHKRVSITVDLGKVELVGGAGFQMAAGISGVHWPNRAYVLVSEEGKSWQLAGDLMDLSIEYGGQASQYGTEVLREFVTDRLQARGRYVRFVFAASQGTMIFLDELKVWRGKQELTRVLAGIDRMVIDPAKLPQAPPLYVLLSQRLQADAATLRENVQKLSVASAERRAELVSQIDAVFRRALDQGIRWHGGKAIFPLDDLHGALLQTNACLLREQGLPTPFLWKEDRWANTSIISMPTQEQQAKTLEIEMMTGEVRADCLNVTNPSEQSLSVQVSLKGLDTPVRLFEVMVTDSNVLRPSSSALLPLGAEGRLTVPAGCTRSVWLSCQFPQGASRVERGVLVLKGADWQREIPVVLRLHDLGFPRELSLLFGGWDYLIGKGDYYGNPGMMEQKIRFMREHGVNTAWAYGAVLPKNDRYDAEGRLVNVQELDWTDFDQWILRWKPVRMYCIFLNTLGNRFHEKLGSPRFERMVGEYYSQVKARAESLGVDSSRLVFELVDEPMTRAVTEKSFLPWQRALKKAGVNIDIFENPLRIDTMAQHSPEIFELSDIICFNLSQSYTTKPEVTRKRLQVMEDVAKKGTTVWLYLCSGPAHALDPTTYYRGISWHAAYYDAKAIMFWALGCTGRSGSTWNPYGATGNPYSPFFVDDQRVDTAKQMEAIREGMQDYEYIQMVRQAVDRLRKHGQNTLAEQGEACLKQALKQVVGAYHQGCFQWDRKDRKDPGMEEHRLKLLKWLETVKKL